MIYQNEEAFSKAHKSGARHGAYLLFGSERYLIEKWAARLEKSADGNIFNIHRFDGKKLDINSLYEAAESFSLMAQSKYIRVNDIAWSKLSAENQKKFTGILEDLADDVILTVTTESDGFDPKSAGAKKLIALFDKVGCAVQLDQRSRAGQIDFLKSIAKKHGCILSTDMGKKILDTCETDMNSLASETAKICAYAGSGEILPTHIEAVATPRTEAKVFDLQKMILAGNTTGAMTLLDDLFYLRESPVMVLSVLTRAYVDLYRARISRDHGKTAPEAAEMFGYKGREFVMRNAFSAAG